MSLKKLIKDLKLHNERAYYVHENTDTEVQSPWYILLKLQDLKENNILFATRKKSTIKEGKLNYHQTFLTAMIYARSN